MLLRQQILLTIRQQILEVLPEATILLFGSRASNTPTEESDWDILVLVNSSSISKTIKKDVHDKIFPLSVSIGAFINLLLVTKNDWEKSPSFYALKKTVQANNLVL